MTAPVRARAGDAPVAPEEGARVVGLAQQLYDTHMAERREFDVLRRYVTGKQTIPLVVPKDAPREVREMARMSRINLIKIVVEAMVESLYLDNLRIPDDPETPRDEAADSAARDVWRVLTENRFGRRQSALYRSAFTYGLSYAVAARGQNPEIPVVRTVSPRRMTAVYDPGQDWPDYALECTGNGLWRVYDGDRVWILGVSGDASSSNAWDLLGVGAHGAAYCPVVRYLDAEDDDADDEPEPESDTVAFGAYPGNVTRVVSGQVAPLMTLQDQADVTSFGLKAAEWYSAFRQRWIKGYAFSRGERVQSGASQLWSFEEHPEDIELGEFSQTDLSGYLASRESTAQFSAVLSQTPVHELTGQLVNLSAEALAAAEAGRGRKVMLREDGFGASHVQLAQLIGDLIGVDIPSGAEAVWRDTSARSFAAVVDGLGKVAQMLQVPPDMLWDRIPGVTLADVERWKAAQQQGDALAGLTSLLDRQATPAAPGTETQTSSGIILPRGVNA